MNITQRITLDLSKRSVFQYIPAKQGDKNSRVLEITLTDSGQNYTPPTGAQASFRAQKPDGTMVLNPAYINHDGTVTAKLTQQTLAVCGEVLCDIFLADDTGAILSSASFVVVVEGAPSGIEIDSTNEFLRLLDLIDRAESITGDFSSALDQLESIRNEAQTAAGQSAKSASEAKTAAANIQKTVTEELENAKQSGEFTGPQGVPGDGCKITNDGAGNAIIEGQSDYLNFLQLSGGTMQGAIDMGKNRLGGISQPQAPDDAVSKESLMELIYPIGSVYMSTSNVSPQMFLGGTWRQIKDQTMPCADGMRYSPNQPRMKAEDEKSNMPPYMVVYAWTRIH